MLPRIFCLVSHSNDLTVLPGLYAAGVTGFQVRDKLLADRPLVELTRRVRHAVPQAMIVVNDRPDIALASGADGVHLGADDVPVAAARRLAPGLLIGATCRDRDEVLRAAKAGADYAGFGPIFTSTSKPGLPAALGLAAVSDASGVLPLIGIGGVGPANAGEVIAAGAYGVAAISGIWDAVDPCAGAARLAAEVACAATPAVGAPLGVGA